MVSMIAFQAGERGLIPGRRKETFFFLYSLYNIVEVLHFFLYNISDFVVIPGATSMRRWYGNG